MHSTTQFTVWSAPKLFCWLGPFVSKDPSFQAKLEIISGRPVVMKKMVLIELI